MRGQTKYRVLDWGKVWQGWGFLRLVLLVALLLALVPTPAHADPDEQLDQQQTVHEDKWHDIHGDKWWAQSFVAGLTGNLTRVALYLKKEGEPGPLVIELRDCVTQTHKGAYYAPGVIISTTVESSAVDSTTGAEYEFTSFLTPTTVISGTCYTIVLHQKGSGGDKDNKYRWSESTEDEYGYGAGNNSKSDDGGANWKRGGSGHDQYFKTYVDDQLDQQQTVHEDKWHDIHEEKWWAQSFVAGLTGNLTKVALYLKIEGNPEPLVIEVSNCVIQYHDPGKVKEGGALVYDGSDYIYAFQGKDQTSFWRYSISRGSWESLADAPDKVQWGGALAYASGHYIYALRGHDSTDFWRYSISGKSWDPPLTSAPEKVKEGGALVYADGDIYAFQGKGQMSFWRYSISRKSWDPPLTSAPGNVKAGGALAYDGSNYIYAFPGDDKTDFWRYSISGKSWETLTDAPHDVKAGGALAYDGSDYIYAFPGVDKTDFWRYSYDASGGTWESLTDAPEKVKEGGALAYDGSNYIYAFRGGDKTDFWRYSYDASGGSWESLADVPGGEDYYAPGNTTHASVESSAITSTTGQEYELTFLTPAAVISGTCYAIVLHQKENERDTDNKYGWSESTYDPYTAGNNSKSDDGGATWKRGGGHGTHDQYFKTYVTVSAYTVTVSAYPINIVANGQSTSTITATVKDQYGNNVPDGTPVTFSTNHGSFASASITVPTTDGQAQATLTSESSTTLVVATIHAQANGQTAVTAVFFNPPGGPPVEDSKTEQTHPGTDIVDAKTEADTEVTKEGSGTPTVTCAVYTSNPQAGFTNDVGKYHDVHIDSAADVISLTIKFYFTAAEIAGRDGSTLSMKYWDGDSWQDCSNQTLRLGPVNGYAGYIEVTITATSSPSLDDLTGEEFGIAGNPPPSPDPVPVGGYIVPVSKLELLAPWVGLVALITFGVAVAARKIKKAQVKEGLSGSQEDHGGRR